MSQIYLKSNINGICATLFKQILFLNMRLSLVIDRTPIRDLDWMQLGVIKTQFASLNRV